MYNTIFFTLNCCWIAEWTIMVVPEDDVVQC